MRILYLHQYFGSPKKHGGSRSYEFAKWLIAQGHEVCVVTSSARIAPEYLTAPPGQTVDIDGIPVVVLDVPYSNELSFSQRIQAFVKFALLASREATRHSADVIFATSTPLTIAIPAIVGKLWQRKPMVFEVRDLWPELPIAVGALKNPVFRWLAQALEWIAYHASAHVVALSPGMAEGVIRRNIPPERVTVIPNSCDLAMFDVPASRGQSIRDRLQLSPGQPLVVYTGTFGLINGVSYLVELATAMQSIDPEIHFLLVGAGAEHEKVTALARERGVLDRNLTIWEPIPKAEMPDVLAAATIATSVFLPIKEMWNNSANKFFDALAANKPLAINYGGWQADILNESGAGIVLPADDTRQAAEDLAAFIHDPARLERAAQASRQLAHERFSRTLMAEKLEAVFKQVAGR